MWSTSNVIYPEEERIYWTNVANKNGVTYHLLFSTFFQLTFLCSNWRRFPLNFEKVFFRRTLNRCCQFDQRISFMNFIDLRRNQSINRISTEIFRWEEEKIIISLDKRRSCYSNEIHSKNFLSFVVVRFSFKANYSIWTNNNIEKITRKFVSKRSDVTWCHFNQIEHHAC